MQIVAAPKAGNSEVRAVPTSWAWPLAWLAAALCTLVGAQLIGGTGNAAAPALVVRTGAALSLLVSRVTGLFPFAAGELLLVIYGVWITFVGARALFAFRARRRTWASVSRGGLRRVIRDGSIVIVLFYALWGLNYSQPPLQLPGHEVSAADVAVEEWISLAEQATAAANDAYVALHGTVDAGRPTALRDSPDPEAAIDEGWRQATAELSLPRHANAQWGRVKWPLLSPLIARAGILGIYFPFTAEANVLRGVPGVYATQTMAHEKAHQRGVAREGEASFVGFVAGALSADPLSRYGAAIYAQGRMLAALARRSPEDYRRIRSLRHPGVQRDLEAAAAYFRRHAGVASVIGSVLNDRYLRANRVPGGIDNYSASTLLLVSYARRNGGNLLPPSGS